MSITVTMRSGRDVHVFLAELEAAAGVTAGDVLLATDEQWQRIVDRTIRQHVDAEGSPFTPYNRTRPYYWYPYGANKRQSKRVRQKLRRLATSLPGARQTGAGLRFESYDAFKRSLDRTGVDLVGPSAPHMMEALKRYVNGQFINVASVNYDRLTARGTSGALVISGPKGRLAQIHNEGEGRNPKREFFAISRSDARMIADTLAQRIAQRLKRL